MGAYDMELKLDSDALAGMRNDADIILKKLVRNMSDKKSMEGSLNIKIDIKLELDTVPTFDENGVQTGTREIFKPVIEHKIGSMVKIEDKANGGNDFQNMELVWDEERSEFVFRPISNTEQTSIFDDQYADVLEPAMIEEKAPQISNHK